MVHDIENWLSKSDFALFDRLVGTVSIHKMQFWTKIYRISKTWQPKLPVGLQVQIGQFGRAEKGVGINFGNSIVGQVQPSKGGHLRHCSGHNFQIKAIVNGQGMEPLVGAVEGILLNIAKLRWLDGKVVDTT